MTPTLAAAIADLDQSPPTVRETPHALRVGRDRRTVGRLLRGLARRAMTSEAVRGIGEDTPDDVA